MSTITHKGQPISLLGELPALGKSAPQFTLTKTDLSDVTLEDFQNKVVVLNLFPSVDTPTCASSVRRFNQEAVKRESVVVLCISMDLPFAQKRFCAAEGLEQVIPASAFRHSEFGKNYGVLINDGKLAGLFARAVFVLDKQAKVIYRHLVQDISHEPDYSAVLAIVDQA